MTDVLGMFKYCSSCDSSSLSLRIGSDPIKESGQLLTDCTPNINHFLDLPPNVTGEPVSALAWKEGTLSKEESFLMKERLVFYFACYALTLI